MANMDFCDKHNMVAFLQKPTGSEEFHQIVDFLVVDGQTIAITEASVRRHLQLADADDISSLPNTEIFDQFTVMSPKKTSWEQFSSNIATAIICLATNRTFKFSKLIFDGEHIPLFDTMLIHDQLGQGEGPTLTVESQHTPITSPSTSQPILTQSISSQEQPSQIPITETITKPTTSSLHLHETKIPQSPSPMPHDLPLPGGHTPGSVEGSMKLKELTDLCTKLHDKVTNLEEDLKQTKKVYGKAIKKLVKKVKHLEDKIKSTKEKRKARMVISDDEEDLVLEDTSKHGRMTEPKNEGVEFDLNHSDDIEEIDLGILSAAKIFADASRERIKTTYTRKRKSTDSLKVSTARGLFSTAEEIQGKISTDEEVAQKLNNEELARAAAREKQEMADFAKALELQKQLDKREVTDDID
ncbi:hypothetical protein Tco_1094371 [Tanacetum coccineum]|uniref:Uncharacterized protein n=1 Tax=Tanacetum coccineum TaxID=301880 RepID=A0ABQ5IFB5_9ASTR